MNRIIRVSRCLVVVTDETRIRIGLDDFAVYTREQKPRLRASLTLCDCNGVINYRCK